MDKNHLLNPFQFVYRKGQSTKSAFLKVTNDLFLIADKVSFLTLLDLSVVDHKSK